jgi:hypothetical protein
VLSQGRRDQGRAVGQGEQVRPFPFGRGRGERPADGQRAGPEQHDRASPAGPPVGPEGMRAGLAAGHRAAGRPAHAPQRAVADRDGQGRVEVGGDEFERTVGTGQGEAAAVRRPGAVDDRGRECAGGRAGAAPQVADRHGAVGSDGRHQAVRRDGQAYAVGQLAEVRLGHGVPDGRPVEAEQADEVLPVGHPLDRPDLTRVPGQAGELRRRAVVDHPPDADGPLGRAGGEQVGGAGVPGQAGDRGVHGERGQQHGAGRVGGVPHEDAAVGRAAREAAAVGAEGDGSDGRGVPNAGRSGNHYAML